MKESVEEKISNILNKIKPFLNNDGGDVEFIKFENGKATFLLKHNEEIEIKDLPYDIKYKIKEINSEGFVVKYQVNDGEVKLFDINNINENILGEDTNIKFINRTEAVWTTVTHTDTAWNCALLRLRL